VSLFASYKKLRFAVLFSYITLVLALVAGVLTKNVGTSGGEIRHTEIRSNIISTTGAEQNTVDEKSEHDED
jgi:hypothetical protein